MLWSQHFQKYTNKKFQTGGREPGAPALDPLLTTQTGNDQWSSVCSVRVIILIVMNA